MITKQILAQYEPTIGIECHVQFNTKTKLFSAVDNDARGRAPNQMTSPICFGMPGVLPVLNEAVVHLAIKAGIALNAEIAHYSKFDRKHYFYPDLPKGYQITQFDQPIVGRGSIEVIGPDGPVKVRITRAHLEEDAGKSTHPSGKDYSLVDLNRAGTPLLEIVSEPDIHSPAIARAYARELYLIMKYAEVSDVDLYQGNMRFDVNISVAKKGSTELGTRAEVKNLNSFRAVERSAEYEIQRQVELLEKGQAVVQETRGWDEAKQKTISQRGKEQAHDYRYFPEPDIPPVVLSQAEIDAVRQSIPLLPADVRSKLHSLKLNGSQIETIVEQKPLADVLLASINKTDTAGARRIANWLAGEVQRITSINEYNWESFKLTPDALVKLNELVEADSLSSTNAKVVLGELIAHGGDVVRIAEANNLIQVSNTDEIEAIVISIIKKNPQAAQDVAAGEAKAIGFLVGQVMKASQGTANPQIVNQLLRQHLGV